MFCIYLRSFSDLFPLQLRYSCYNYLLSLTVKLALLGGTEMLTLQ